MSFISAFKLADEPGRLSALYRYEILDTDPEQAFADIIQIVKSIFGVPMVAISLIDSDRQWFKASTGLNVPETSRSVAFCDYTIRSADALIVQDATQDPRFAENPFVTGPAGIRCYLGVPLTTPEGYNVGSLCIIGTEPRSFTEDDAKTLANFARLVMSQLELRLLARRDGLTGALTRRAFQEQLGKAADSAKSQGVPMSLLLLDIDHFKSVNDRFGHPAGDEVLKTMAEIIQCELRPSDAFGRLGGEEFGILVQGVSLEQAGELAEIIRQKISRLRLPGLRDYVVTVSCGVAPWHADQRRVDRWLAAADVALYAAKRAGRDQVVLAA
jgi:diguanylate cyclase (GGDEF)-like protein